MILTAQQDGIAEIALDRPPANALNPELVKRLNRAHADACSAGARAVILTGRPGMFSGGLDVPELLTLPRAVIEKFWRGLFDLTQALATSPVPVIAAISGHAPAGGAVVALHCDYRIAASGPFKIGFNEVAVGLPVPEAILLALQQVVGHAVAHRLAMTAALVSAEEALQLGLVDELVEPEKLAERARAFARQLAALPPIALNRTRLLCRARLAEVLNPARDAKLATEFWFSPETQAGMRALVERLKKK